jgi:transposase-like protein
MKKRRQYSAEFKTQIVLELLSNRSTLNELATKYELHPVQVSSWKKQFLSEAPRVFGDKRKKEERTKEQHIEELYKQIGQQKVENDWLKKKVGLLCS